MRSLTSQELTLYRSDGLATKLYVIIDEPTIIFTAQVSQTFTTHDRIVKITYTNASGNLASVLPGMTILIGSTLADGIAVLLECVRLGARVSPILARHLKFSGKLVCM